MICEGKVCDVWRGGYMMYGGRVCDMWRGGFVMCGGEGVWCVQKEV